MNCLVTGATGFIGRDLCRVLRSRGHSVTALSHHAAVLDDGTATHAVDLANEVACAALDTLLQDIDVVYHLAGVAHQNAPREQYQALNVMGSLRLARVARDAGVSCFVYLSSVKAMGPAPGPEPRGERQCNAPRDDYGRSKREAEEGLELLARDGSMRLVIIRPALVYGAGARGNLQALAAAVGRGMPRPPPGGRRAMVSRRDLVDLLCLAPDHAPAGVTTWIACEDQGYSARELHDALCVAAGRPVGRAWLPLPLWWLAGAALDLLRPGADSTYHKLFATELYSSAAAQAAAPWRPKPRLLQDWASEGEAP